MVLSFGGPNRQLTGKIIADSTRFITNWSWFPGIGLSMRIALRRAGPRVETEVPVPVRFRGTPLACFEPMW